MTNPLFDTSLLNFASILATENNTKITISNIPVGTVLTNGIVTAGDIVVTINKNELCFSFRKSAAAYQIAQK
jgi:hypothetical protein